MGFSRECWRRKGKSGTYTRLSQVSSLRTMMFLSMMDLSSPEAATMHMPITHGSTTSSLSSTDWTPSTRKSLVFASVTRYITVITNNIHMNHIILFSLLSFTFFFFWVGVLLSFTCCYLTLLSQLSLFLAAAPAYLQRSKCPPSLSYF